LNIGCAPLSWGRLDVFEVKFAHFGCMHIKPQKRTQTGVLSIHIGYPCSCYSNMGPLCT